MSRYLWCVLPFFVLGCLFSCNDDGLPPPNGGPDTTSHSFTFSLDTLGDGNSSVLYDVAVISENDVIAVGEIFLRDSSGGFGDPPYGVARWDGTRWALRRVRFQSGQGELNISPIRGILQTRQNEIWLAAGSVFRWDGSSAVAQLSLPRLSLGDPSATIEKLWGTTTSLYGVGNAGTIAWFNGTWQKLTSGTTVTIRDIWGTATTQTILAVASMGPQLPQAREVLRIQNNVVTSVSDSGLPLDLKGVWFADSSRYYLTGEGVFTCNQLGTPWQQDASQPTPYKDAIRGNGWNDIVIAGSFGLVSHYSGSTWKHYTGNEVPSFYGRYHAVDIRQNTMVAVGWMNDQAIALRGRRH